jgi:hypothetical protein
MFAPQAKSVPLLEALQLLIFFSRDVEVFGARTVSFNYIL